MQQVKPFEAFACVMAAMVIIGLIDNFVVVIAAEAGLWQFHAFRGLMSLPILIGAAVLAGARLWPLKPRAVFARSALITSAMLIYFAALALVSVPIAVAGLFTAPFFVLLFSALFRREAVGPIRWIAAGIGFLGILLVIQPDLDSLSLATFLPICAGAFYGIGNLATRSWCEGEDTLTLTLYSFAGLFLSGCVGLAVVVMTGGGEGFVAQGYATPTLTFLFWTGVQAIGSIIGVSLIIRGYQLGEASYVAIYEYVLMLTASFWAWSIFGQGVDGLAAIGMALIVLAGAVVVLRSDGAGATS